MGTMHGGKHAQLISFSGSILVSISTLLLLLLPSVLSMVCVTFLPSAYRNDSRELAVTVILRRMRRRDFYAGSLLVGVISANERP